jgi:hypothetical protein
MLNVNLTAIKELDGECKTGIGSFKNGHASQESSVPAAHVSFHNLQDEVKSPMHAENKDFEFKMQEIE